MKIKYKILLAKIIFYLINIKKRKKIIRLKKNNTNGFILSIPDGASSTLVAK